MVKFTNVLESHFEKGFSNSDLGGCFFAFPKFADQPKPLVFGATKSREGRIALRTENVITVRFHMLVTFFGWFFKWNVCLKLLVFFNVLQKLPGILC